MIRPEPMKYDPERHHRRSVRLRGYDYSQAGAYFVTICTQGRACLFGDVADSQMRLNDAGRVVERCWHEIPIHFPHVALDAFVVMPNHVHEILIIAVTVGATHALPLPNNASPRPHGPQPDSIGAIIGSFKSAATKHINELRNIVGAPVWQRNYYEHIIRNDESMNRIREYIVNNPLQWQLDRENPCIGGRGNPALYRG